MSFFSFKVKRARFRRIGVVDPMQMIIAMAITGILVAGYSGSSIRSGETDLSFASDTMKTRVDNLKTSASIGRDFGLPSASSIVIDVNKGSALPPTIKVYDDLGNSGSLDTVTLPSGSILDVCMARISLSGLCNPATVTTGHIRISLKEPYGAVDLYQDAGITDDPDILGIKVTIVQGTMRKGIYFDRNFLVTNNQ